MGTWWTSDSACDCAAGFAYLDDQVMQCRACEAVFTREATAPTSQPEPFFVVFDGPPAPESGRFVECETADGHSVRVGDWEEYPGHPGLWRLGPFVEES